MTMSNHLLALKCRSFQEPYSRPGGAQTAMDLEAGLTYSASRATAPLYVVRSTPYRSKGHEHWVQPLQAV